jgi:hypothetical protein
MTIFGMQEQIFLLSLGLSITFQSLLSATDTFFLFLFIRKGLLCVDNFNIHPIHELKAGEKEEKIPAVNLN